METRKCIKCQKEFISAYKTKIFCSIRCQAKHHRDRTGYMKTFDLPCGTVGSISELTVAIDLMKKQYEVYRPLSTNCSGDLLVEKNKKFTKIEVRTGHESPINKRLTYPVANIRSEVLAIVIHRLNKIVYLTSIGKKEVKL